jgi:hypothetical protein
MFTDEDLEWIVGTNPEESMALVWVIDGQCLYDLPILNFYAEIFLNHDEAIDVSDQYLDHEGITVRFIKNGETIDDFQTSEYFGSILLSNPQVVDLSAYPYGRYVISPNAEFDGEKFIITNRDMTGYAEWR